MIVFENEFGEQRRYQVDNSISYPKTLHGVGMGVFSAYAISYYYYDKKVVYMHAVNNSLQSKISLGFVKYPIDYDAATENKFEIFPAHQLLNFWFPNFNPFLSNGSFSDGIQISYNAPKFKLTCFNKAYTNVFTIQSSGYVSANQNPNEINTLFYDEFAGIIGFDDIKNKHWRLKN
jgi:hypothetical protein